MRIDANSYKIFDKRVQAMMQKNLVKIMASVEAVSSGRPLTTKMTTDGLIRDYYSWFGVGAGQEIPDGGDPTSTRPTFSNKKTFTLRAFMQGISYTELSEHLAPNVIKDYQEFLGVSYEMTLELLRYNLYYYGLEGRTVPAYYGVNIVDVTADDGLSYFNDGHTYIGSGQTNANIPTADLSWSSSGREAMAALPRNWTDPLGNPSPFFGMEWVVPLELASRAPRDLNTEKEPETNNNAQNLARYQGKGGTELKSYRVWNQMNNGEFMLRTKGMGNGRPGWIEAHLGGYEKRVKTYESESGERLVLFYKTIKCITGMDPSVMFLNKKAV